MVSLSVSLPPCDATLLDHDSVVFWGAAIVIFLLKIINLHNADEQGFWVEVSSQVENGKGQPFYMKIWLIPGPK
jgi:hypothetical protein